VNTRRPQLAFVSPLFLFPNDAGGKIRTSNILRGLKGGAFQVRLLSPATAQQAQQWAPQLAELCDLLSALPVNVAADVNVEASATVAQQAARGDVDLFVFDFVHASVLKPQGLHARSVCFTHNVEAEIFERHAQQARGPLRRWLWSSQHAKMRRFERDALRGYDRVIAVSDRDARRFGSDYGLAATEAIPTGVDLDHFDWHAPPPVDAAKPPTVVFIGSMDSAANIEAVRWTIEAIWPLVHAAQPQARLRIVGRRPPASLVSLARGRAEVTFTGFVDDVRPQVRDAHVSVIPLQVGGGTRIKAFEAMAMGCPVVSTALGVEGLDVEPGRHYLRADGAQDIAAAIVRLLAEPALRLGLSRQARELVEQRFGHRVAALAFEQICLRALQH
jgi:polysaccharide biosynthesis protein PslH